MTLFWLWLGYSFLGWGLEVGFAYATGNPKKDRKCCLLLPLCPVYGIGAVGILLLPEGISGSVFLLWLWGGAVATAAEYILGWFYEEGLGVKFWDYSERWGNVKGRVCPAFGVIWGGLAVALKHWVQPGMMALAEKIPPEVFPAAFWLVMADGFFTLAALWKSGDTGVLKWYDQLGS